MDDGKVTITIEIDAELLAQVTEVLKSYDLTPEEAAVQFFEYAAVTCDDVFVHGSIQFLSGFFPANDGCLLSGILLCCRWQCRVLCRRSDNIAGLVWLCLKPCKHRLSSASGRSVIFQTARANWRYDPIAVVYALEDRYKRSFQ